MIGPLIAEAVKEAAQKVAERARIQVEERETARQRRMVRAFIENRFGRVLGAASVDELFA